MMWQGIKNAKSQVAKNYIFANFDLQYLTFIYSHHNFIINMNKKNLQRNINWFRWKQKHWQSVENREKLIQIIVVPSNTMCLMGPLLSYHCIITLKYQNVCNQKKWYFNQKPDKSVGSVDRGIATTRSHNTLESI